LPLPEVVVWVEVELEPHENELELLVEVLVLLLVLQPELDEVCSPWNAVRVGRLEGTGKSGQLLPCAASM
jgi:hypothetical protein